MRELLTQRGYTEVPFKSDADIYIVNTCTVTNIADRKSRQILHRAKKMNPDAVVIAVGCYVETDRKKVEEDPAIDLAIGNNKKGKIAEILDDFLKTRNVSEEKLSEALDGKDGVRPSYEDMQLTKPGHTRAFIKIQDGCSQFCSYCIIPYARGRIRSRDNAEILREVQGLADSGVKEVVLTGIHISSFGLERGVSGPVRFDPVKGGENLLELLTEISGIRGIERIRLGSLEPRVMTKEFIEGIAGLSKICPHFHLSLQSGCDRTLKSMNRHYTTKDYLQSVELLREYFDRPAVTTDVIVGFPGETEEDFEQTREFLEKISFYEIHVFKYSRRHGTVADAMENQIPESVKGVRSDILLELTAKQAAEYRRSFQGEEEEILIEEPVEIGGRTFMTGHTMRYVQGVIPRTADSSGGDLPAAGTIVKGKFGMVLPGSSCLELKTNSSLVE